MARGCGAAVAFIFASFSVAAARAFSLYLSLSLEGWVIHIRPLTQTKHNTAAKISHADIYVWASGCKTIPAHKTSKKIG